MSAARHPAESDLALFAGRESALLQSFLLNRHLGSCTECQAKVAEYRDLRDDLSVSEIPGVNWNLLAAEMRGNIRVGLEAGACVRTTPVSTAWSAVRSWANALGPRAAVGFATLAVLAVSGFYVRDVRTRSADTRSIGQSSPVLQTTRSGVELRSGDTSMILLNRSDASNQTVSAGGDIAMRVVDGGSVTINNVSLQ